MNSCTTIRELSAIELDQVSGGQIVIGPISPEPPIPPIVLSNGSPILSFSGSPSAILTVPKPTAPFPPHVGPFPIH